MKKSLFASLSCFSLSFSAFAFFPDIVIQDFEGQYRSPAGSGSALVFDLPNDWKGQENVKNEFLFSREKISILQQDDGYLLETEDLSLLWESPPPFLSGIESGSWDSVNFLLSDDEISLSIGSLLTAGESSLDLRGLSLNCELSSDDLGDPMKNLLHSCFNGRSSLRAGLINTSDESLNFMNVFYNQLFHSLNMDKHDFVTQSRFDDLTLNISGNQLSGSIVARDNFGATVRIQGAVFYQADSDRISVRIDRARVGIFSVLNTLFNELGGQQSDNFIVERPWIHIQW